MITFAEATKADNLNLLRANACRASFALGVECTLRSNGSPITPATRDEMLAAIAAGKHVELELDVLAYEQRPGEQNRNNVRFRDGAMTSLGRSGTGKPVLRDHEQDDSMAVAGRIISSSTEKRGEGDYAINQTWRLTAPWACDLALRDLLSTASIGWNPTGPVMCSVCNAPIFTVCYHCRGDRLSEKTGEDGVKRMVRDPKGDVVVEWVFTSAELVETSIVPVPAVPSARIEGIRAALSAHDGGVCPPGDDIMDPKLLALLGLAATAGVPEVLSAVEKLKTGAAEADTLRADAAELKIVKAEFGVANQELATLRAEKRQSACDAFIAGALSSGRIGKADEASWRALYELSSDRATKLMSERAEGTATPVGQPRVSEQPIAGTPPAGAQPGAPGAPADPIAATSLLLKANGLDPALVAKYATKFGVQGDPMKAIAKHCAGQEVE
jgi:Mu-like prophage I protein